MQIRACKQEPVSSITIWRHMSNEICITYFGILTSKAIDWYFNELILRGSWGGGGGRGGRGIFGGAPDFH